MMKIGTVLICSMLLAQTALAKPQQKSVYTPKPGSVERKAVLDALRKPVNQAMSQNVIFHNVTIKVKDGWAYVDAVGKDTNGKALKKFEGQYFPTQALLRKNGKNWQVLSWGSGGGTDAIDVAKTKYPQAPREIFPPFS